MSVMSDDCVDELSSKKEVLLDEYDGSLLFVFFFYKNWIKVDGFENFICLNSFQQECYTVASDTKSNCLSSFFFS